MGKGIEIGEGSREGEGEDGVVIGVVEALHVLGLSKVSCQRSGSAPLNCANNSKTLGLLSFHEQKPIVWEDGAK